MPFEVIGFAIKTSLHFFSQLRIRPSVIPMMIRVEIKPELLTWARERAGFDAGALAHCFAEAGGLGAGHGDARAQTHRTGLPAPRTHRLVLRFPQESPVESIPIPDFRTSGNKRILRPSPEEKVEG